ncbi:MAG TPA: tyrosine-type recombinase/integrase [bacterium]|nr:tyrosine-type recombinase/integrase [bacterium]
MGLCAASPPALFLPVEWTFADLDRRVVEAYLNALRQSKGWQPGSLAHQVSALSGVFRFLVARHHLKSNPCQSLRPRLKESPAPLPEGEEAAVLGLFAQEPDGLRSARLLALLELLYGAGLRPSQVYQVRAIQCAADAPLARIQWQQGSVEQPLTPPGLNRLRAYLEQRLLALESAADAPHEAPFWVDRRGRACSPALLARQVQRAMRRQGLSGGAASLRMLAAKHFGQRGGDLRSLQRLLGAKRLGRLDRYRPAPEFRAVLEQFRKAHPRNLPE